MRFEYGSLSKSPTLQTPTAMAPARLTLLVTVFAFAASGCYHASVVTTGLPPGPVVVDQPFASSWVYGLVPPKTVDAAAECPDGVAMVETELSFLNQLVGALTMGIYTPMHIKVTCAATESMAGEETEADVVVEEHSSVVEAFEVAAEEAVVSGVPVIVRFDQP